MPSLSELQRRFAATVLDLAREPDARIAVYRQHDLRQLSQRARRHVSRRARADRRAVLQCGGRRVRPRASGDGRRPQRLRRRIRRLSSQTYPYARRLAVPAGRRAARMGNGRSASRRRCRRFRATNARGAGRDSGGGRRAAALRTRIRRAGCCARHSRSCASGRRTRMARYTTAASSSAPATIFCWCGAKPASSRRAHRGRRFSLARRARWRRRPRARPRSRARRRCDVRPRHGAARRHRERHADRDRRRRMTGIARRRD